jgi:hypothetical protein
MSVQSFFCIFIYYIKKYIMSDIFDRSEEIYKTKYIKYTNKYSQLGGQYTKKILYENGNFTTINNIDDDILDMNSTFLIGSVTKIFTVYTILILHQNNLLNINDNIIKYIKTKNKDNNDMFQKIKILDIINHKRRVTNKD